MKEIEVRRKENAGEQHSNKGCLLPYDLFEHVVGEGIARREADSRICSKQPARRQRHRSHVLSNGPEIEFSRMSTEAPSSGISNYVGVNLVVSPICMMHNQTASAGGRSSYRHERGLCHSTGQPRNPGSIKLSGRSYTSTK